MFRSSSESYSRFRLNFELETRAKELSTLKSQLMDLQLKFDSARSLNHAVAADIDSFADEFAVSSRETRSDLGRSSSTKVEQRLLSLVSAQSSSLAELLTAACDAEMRRTRMMDALVETAEASLEAKQRQLREICDLRNQLEATRRDYDGQLVDDFHALLDLVITAETLEAELVREKRSQTHQGKRRANSSVQGNKSVVVPIRESTIQLQEHVQRLRSELSGKEKGYADQLASAEEKLSRLKSNKVRAKSNFHQSLKSVFRDLQIMSERVARSEATLEKLNVHYKLEEEEVVSIVSPIIESIDQVRDRIDAVTAHADRALYTSYA